MTIKKKPGSRNSYRVSLTYVLALNTITVMSDITLTSKEYCESVFVDGPKFDRLSAFVSGPDAQVQGKLIVGTGINLNDSTISVNTATSVGTSDLPVTASAVNTKLGDYVNDIQAEDDSITVTKTGSSVTLKANASGGSKWVTDDISGAGITYLFLGKDENHSTVNSIFVCGPLYGDDNSIFVAGPIVFNEAMILQDYYNSNNKLLLNSGDTEHYGPIIGSIDGAIEGPTLVLVGGKGGSVLIEARDSYGNNKTAFINYNNIDKLINLLNS